VSWPNDLVTLLEDASIGTLNHNVFLSTKSAVLKSAVLASGDAVLSIVETSGIIAERTQNSVIRPGYIKPAASIVARARAYETAKAMAQDAYDAFTPIRNTWIVNSGGTISGWYREINPQQEPFDMGVDDVGNARCGFNVIAVKRP
jgi:hypothetical protein